VYILKPNGQIRYACHRALEVYDYSLNELKELGIKDLRAPESLDDYPVQIAKALEGTALCFETVHRREDGSRFPMKVSPRSLVMETVPCIQSIIRDITEAQGASSWCALPAQCHPNLPVGPPEELFKLLIYDMRSRKG
jgi:PAS domain S-box-containing protein